MFSLDHLISSWSSILYTEIIYAWIIAIRCQGAQINFCHKTGYMWYKVYGICAPPAVSSKIAILCIVSSQCLVLNSCFFTCCLNILGFAPFDRLLACCNNIKTWIMSKLYDLTYHFNLFIYGKTVVGGDAGNLIL